MESFRVRQDEALARLVTLRGLDGRALADTYLGTEGLSASLLVGDGRAAAATMSAAWSDATAGEVLVSLDAEDVATVAPGAYTARLLIYDGGEPYPAWEARVEIVEAPGDAAAPLAYGTYDGVLRRAGEWLPKLQGVSSQSRFAEELHEAFDWTNRQVLSRCRAYLERRAGGYLGDPEAAGLLSATEDAEGDDDAALTEARLAIIRDALESGTGLILTPGIVAANEHYAASVVLGRVMPAKDGADWAGMAAAHRGRANGLLSAEAFGVDADGDGAAEFTLGPA